MEAQIRKANKHDYESIMHLYGQFVNNVERFAKSGNDSYFKVLEDPNSHIDIAIVDNKVIAFIMYTVRTVVRYPSPIVELDELFVSPEYRGKGVGKHLVEHVLSFAKENDYHYVFVASANERIDAHEFYNKLEFDKYGLHYRRKP